MRCQSLKNRICISIFVACVFVLSACSKSSNESVSNPPIPVVEPFPITSKKLQNCSFTTTSPIYTMGGTITPNTIHCDAGVPTSVQLLTESPLPSGLQLDSTKLALVGTAKERVTNAPYVIYLENDAGYVRVQLNLTVQ